MGDGDSAGAGHGREAVVLAPSLGASAAQRRVVCVGWERSEVKCRVTCVREAVYRMPVLTTQYLPLCVKSPRTLSLLRQWPPRVKQPRR